MPRMKHAIVLLLPLNSDEIDCDGLSEGCSCLFWLLLMCVFLGVEPCWACWACAARGQRITMPRMKHAIVLLLPLNSDEIDCDGLSEGCSCLLAAVDVFVLGCWACWACAAWGQRITMPRMKHAIVLLLPLNSDEIDCDGLSEGCSCLLAAVDVFVLGCWACLACAAWWQRIAMPRMKHAIVLLLPLNSDEIDCDGLSEGCSCLLAAVDVCVFGCWALLSMLSMCGLRAKDHNA